MGKNLYKVVELYPQAVVRKNLFVRAKYEDEARQDPHDQEIVGIEHDIAWGGEAVTESVEQIVEKQLESVVNSDEAFDDFLQEAVMELHGLWINAGGAEMKSVELQALNDVLTTFFDDKRNNARGEVKGDTQEASVAEQAAVADFAKGILAYVEVGNVIELHECGFVEELKQAVRGGVLQEDREEDEHLDSIEKEDQARQIRKFSLREDPNDDA